MEPFETIYTDKKVVACDGGKGAMGHPRVFLNMGEFEFADCPYCSRRYVLRKAGSTETPASSAPAHPATGQLSA
jgi:uncharacterized Zn-finger protein